MLGQKTLEQSVFMYQLQFLGGKGVGVKSVRIFERIGKECSNIHIFMCEAIPDGKTMPFGIAALQVKTLG